MSLEIKKKHSIRFDEWSKGYDRSILQYIVFNKSHNVFFREMAPFLKKGTRVLDIGCGTGKFVFRLQKINDGLEIHGVDISKDMIGKARAKSKNDEIEFKVGDVEELPYEKNYFDIITCSNSFHHYPSQKKAVSEMQRILKDEGKLMVIDGCRDKLLGRIIFGIVEIVEGDVYHIFEKEFREMLFSMGFDKVVQKRFNPFAPLLFTLGYARKKEEAVIGEAINKIEVRPELIAEKEAVEG